MIVDAQIQARHWRFSTWKIGAQFWAHPHTRKDDNIHDEMASTKTTFKLVTSHGMGHMAHW